MGLSMGGMAGLVGKLDWGWGVWQGWLVFGLVGIEIGACGRAWLVLGLVGIGLGWHWAWVVAGLVGIGLGWWRAWLAERARPHADRSLAHLAPRRREESRRRREET